MSKLGKQLELMKLKYEYKSNRLLTIFLLQFDYSFKSIQLGCAGLSSV